MSHESIEVIPLDRPASPQSGTTNRSSVLTRRDPAQHEKVKLLTHALLSVLGQDPGRPELRGTPRRVARMYAGLLSGYEVEIKTLLNGALFDVDYHLQPRGVAVIIDAFHVHTAMRGARRQEAHMRASAMRGRFREDATLRREFMQQLK